MYTVHNSHFGLLYTVYTSHFGLVYAAHSLLDYRSPRCTMVHLDYRSPRCTLVHLDYCTPWCTLVRLDHRTKALLCEHNYYVSESMVCQPESTPASLFNAKAAPRQRFAIQENDVDSSLLSKHSPELPRWLRKSSESLPVHRPETRAGPEASPERGSLTFPP